MGPIALVVSTALAAHVAWPDHRRGTRMLRAGARCHHPPSVPPFEQRSAGDAEHGSLVVLEDEGVAGGLDEAARDVGQAAGLEHDIPVRVAREKAPQLVEHLRDVLAAVEAAADGLVTDLGLEADRGLEDSVEDAERGRLPLLEGPRD